jgi:hypothetical protein
MRRSLALSSRAFGSTLPRRSRLGDTRSNAPLHRRPFLDQVCIPGFVFGHIVGGGTFSFFSLTDQLRHGRLLFRGAGFQRLLDLEVGCCVLSSGRDLPLEFGLANASSVELALE